MRKSCLKNPRQSSKNNKKNKRGNSRLPLL
nr:MAG TPA: hypothetical protein [Ackermannviridae sp.]